MIETPEQFERAEEAITKMKRFLLAARRTHTPEAYCLQVLVITCHPERYRGLDGLNFSTLRPSYITVLRREDSCEKSA